MAAQYSNRQFFRKTPNLYLSKFFEAKGIQLDVNINQLKEQDTNILQGALNKLSPEQITDIETEFQNINALACEGGILALIDEAHFHKNDAFIEEIAVIDGFHLIPQFLMLDFSLGRITAAYHGIYNQASCCWIPWSSNGSSMFSKIKH